MAIILLLFPVVAAMGGVVIAALLGSWLTADGKARNEGSELVDLNV
jgi:hypothetical protein